MSVITSAYYLNLSPTLLNSLTLKEVMWCYGWHMSHEMSSSSLTSLSFCWIVTFLTVYSHSNVLPVQLNLKLHTSILSMLTSCALFSSQAFGLRQQVNEFITHCGLHPRSYAYQWCCTVLGGKPGFPFKKRLLFKSYNKLLRSSFQECSLGFRHQFKTWYDMTLNYSPFCFVCLYSVMYELNCMNRSVRLLSKMLMKFRQKNIFAYF